MRLALYWSEFHKYSITYAMRSSWHDIYSDTLTNRKIAADLFAINLYYLTAQANLGINFTQKYTQQLLK